MIAEGGFSAVVEPSLETAKFWMLHSGEGWQSLGRVSVMEIHKICDEKTRTHGTTEVHWFELGLVDSLGFNLGGFEM